MHKHVRLVCYVSVFSDAQSDMRFIFNGYFSGLYVFTRVGRRGGEFYKRRNATGVSNSLYCLTHPPHPINPPPLLKVL